MELRAEGVKRDYLRDSGGTNIFTAVHETDFCIRGGELIEIVGRSGSGKSTLANMLAGLLLPTSGSVFFDDKDIYSMNDDARSMLRNSTIGIIPQGQTGLSSLTVMENITAPAIMYDATADIATIEHRAIELMEMMDISDLANVYSNELSGGELRRLSIARALINEPKLIVADEPTGDLDDETTDEVLRLIRQCVDDGAAALIVTHEKDAAAYADRIYRMEKGHLTEDVRP